MSDTTSPPKLYAAREPVFPKKVKGRFRALKWWIMAATLLIYYVTPWLRWDRGPALPDQAVLIDLANRRFYFFSVEIWAHEFYFVAGLLIMAGLGLFLFTSALGRVWCGYTCPQTIWTDLFVTVERWIEGDRNARLRLHKSKLSFRKLRLRGMKFALWLLIALGTGGAWVFYFADAPTLLRDLVTLQAPFVAYATIGVLTATTFFFAGFAREQICIYACPWPRIQAAMMDPDTITIAYREWRGEPRGKHRKAAGAEALGDCIDCKACVNVCPMGIDIRDGQQLACITCGLCIDACDEMMDKIGKPRGLVGYMALTDEERERDGAPVIPVRKHIFRPRTLLYTALWTLVGAGLLVALFVRPAVDLTVAPVRNPTFVTLSDGSIRNTYDVRLRNKTGAPVSFRVTQSSDAPMTLTLEGAEADVARVPADTAKMQRVYLVAPATSPAALDDRTPVTLSVENLDTGETASSDTVFNGKGQ